MQLPPHDISLEKDILGAVLIGGDEALVKTMDILTLDDFYNSDHQKIFAEMCAMAIDGKAVDFITTRVKDIDPFYFTALSENVVSAANVKFYAEKLKGISKKRTLYMAGHELFRQIEADESVEIIEADLMDVLIAKSDSNYIDAKTATLSSLRSIDEAVTHGITRGIKTGFSGLDEIIGGLKPGEVAVIAARPGVGKSSLALNITTQVAEKGVKVGFVSMEMSTEQLTDRILFSHADIDAWKYGQGMLTGEDLALINKAGSWLSELPISFDSKRGQTVEQIYARAKRLQLQGKLDLLIIDYLGLIRATKGNSLYEQVSDVMNQIVTFAGMLDVPIILLHNLNRAPSTRKDGRPNLADLRDSGKIEQDAHQVWLIHRPEAMGIALGKDDQPLHKGFSEIIIAKNRNGRTGVVEMQFLEQYTRFESATGLPL